MDEQTVATATTAVTEKTAESNKSDSAMHMLKDRMIAAYDLRVSASTLARASLARPRR